MMDKGPTIASATHRQRGDYLSYLMARRSVAREIASSISLDRGRGRAKRRRDFVGHIRHLRRLTAIVSSPSAGTGRVNFRTYLT